VRLDLQGRSLLGTLPGCGIRPPLRLAASAGWVVEKSGEEDRHRCEESRYLRFEIFLQ